MAETCSFGWLADSGGFWNLAFLFRSPNPTLPLLARLSFTSGYISQRTSLLSKVLCFVSARCILPSRSNLPLEGEAALSLGLRFPRLSCSWGARPKPDVSRHCGVCGARLEPDAGFAGRGPALAAGSCSLCSKFDSHQCLKKALQLLKVRKGAMDRLRQPYGRHVKHNSVLTSTGAERLRAP